METQNDTKAIEHKFNLGKYSITGYFGQDQLFYIDALFAMELVAPYTEHEGDYLQAVFGKELLLFRLEVEGKTRTHYGILLEQFNELLAKLEKLGNTMAAEVRYNLVSVMLNQYFSLVFNQHIINHRRVVMSFDEGLDSYIRSKQLGCTHDDSVGFAVLGLTPN